MTTLFCHSHCCDALSLARKHEHRHSQSCRHPEESSATDDVQLRIGKVVRQDNRNIPSHAMTSHRATGKEATVITSLPYLHALVNLLAPSLEWSPESARDVEQLSLVHGGCVSGLLVMQRYSAECFLCWGRPSRDSEGSDNYRIMLHATSDNPSLTDARVTC
ncbi:hypothetical protein VTK73DRAFT_454 [Phialemonium thermophilum]|uniref:Uncharacterized protein n=1 Tax=Phialemonium thermophilum TaxID=223376 RepID=A0ABR3VV53_9PEZI